MYNLFIIFRSQQVGEEKIWIAHINHYFPFIRQTFTYREIEALRKEGLDVTPFSMKKVEEFCQSDEAHVHLKSTTYLNPAISVNALLANLKQFLKKPFLYLKWLLLSVFSPYTVGKTWRELIQSLFQFSRAAVLADEIRSVGVTPHLHAQFSDGAATTALIASKYLNSTFSFYSHTSTNVQFIKEKLASAEFVFSISEFDKSILCRSVAGLDDKIHVVHCGIPLENWFFNQDNRKKNTLISIGGLDEVKGHHILIKACDIVRKKGIDVNCRIIGDGPYRKELEQLIKGLHLQNNVVLSGFMSQEEIKPLLQDASVFVLACVKIANGDMDGIPVALMEAMAAGAPVVSTRLSGIEELIEDGKSGWLAESGNVEDLAELIMQILGNNEKSVEIVENARKTIEEDFSLEAQGRRMAEIFRESLNK
jgi:glycosyltransferase involved in cell wall biosynthesis